MIDITTQGKKSNFPFELPSDDDSEVYSSVEVNRREVITRTTGAHAVASLPQLSLTLPNGPALVPVMRTPFSIGGSAADLHIPGDFVDDWHAILQNNHGVISVEDVRSTNGVFLKIENELTLEDHDQIAIGDQRFIFRSTWDRPTESEGKKAKIYGAKPPLGARLIQIFEDGIQGAVWAIEEGLLITSGHTTGSSNNALIKDASISSPHATILRTGQGYSINDMNSASGIFIRLGGSVELFDGDTFLIANTPISLRYP